MTKKNIGLTQGIIILHIMHSEGSRGGSGGTKSTVFHKGVSLLNIGSCKGNPTVHLLNSKHLPKAVTSFFYKNGRN